MANPITETTFRPIDGYVSSLSRYADAEIIYYGVKQKLTFKTYKRSEYPETQDDRYAVISGGMQYRPDLLSQEVYGSVDFWWKIMEANEIKDIFDFKTGMTIRLPSNIF